MLMVFGVFGLLSVRDDVAVPAFGIYRAGRSEIENRCIPRYLQRLHRLAQ